MIAEVKYKKTGIDWLEEIPIHWKVVRLKNIVEINARNLSEQTSKNTLINYIDITNVNGDGDILEVQQIKFKDAPSRARRVLKRNDTIISTVRTYLKAITAIREDNFVGSTGFAVLTPDAEKLNPDYLYYYASSKAFVNKVMVNSVGVAYPAITPTTLACLPFILPPIEEQNIIVNILNSESAKITHFIKTKQRFIELLKEQRQSIITNAVTKGIDDKVKMKETVLGEIPEHWEVRRLKTFVSSSTNGVWGNEPKNNDEDVYCIRVADIDLLTYGISEEKLTIRNISKEEQDNRLLKKGDLIIEKSGGGELSPVGRIVIYNLDHKAVTSNFMARLNINENINTEYLYFLFSSLYSQRKNVPAIKATTGIQNIDLYAYLQNKVGFPPSIPEQQEIIKHIKSETKTLDIAISKAEREIELIKEYREAMIAEAVTGKIIVNC